jgi:hypothetical protein
MATNSSCFQVKKDSNQSTYKDAIMESESSDHFEEIVARKSRVGLKCGYVIVGLLNSLSHQLVVYCAMVRW